jgi:uncharacterized membrane protein
MSSAASRYPSNPVRWAFFLFVLGCVILVIDVDELFLIHPADPEWAHIAKFKWLLLVHGVAGATALFTGPWQFSDTLRRTNLTLHRWLGRIYVGAIFIAAPMAFYLGVTFESPITSVEQPAQAGLWFLTTAIALICVLNRNIAQHKLWMMKSYCFCLVFVASRVTDAVPIHFTDAGLDNFLWYLVVAALVGPDIVMTVRELWRKRVRTSPSP